MRSAETHMRLGQGRIGHPMRPALVVWQERGEVAGQAAQAGAFRGVTESVGQGPRLFAAQREVGAQRVVRRQPGQVQRTARQVGGQVDETVECIDVESSEDGMQTHFRRRPAA